jgi:hypothetical protein
MEEIKKLAMDIQFFADENDDDDLDNDDLDNFEDDSEEEEEAEESSEEENGKTEESEEKEEKEEKEEEPKKKQTREENAKYKQLRQESKRIQEENARAKEQGKLEGIKLAYGGKNKFTGEELVDEYDVKVFMTMLEMEKEGLDPVEDYPKYVTNLERKKAEESKKVEQDQEWYANDAKFLLKHIPMLRLTI